jgi:hypothetical protein
MVLPIRYVAMAAARKTPTTMTMEKLKIKRALNDNRGMKRTCS